MKKINDLKPNDLNCNIFSVYDYEGMTITELLCEFFTKINECISQSNETFELAKWLVSEGLSLEVAKKLDIWLTDGTLENIINESLFNDLKSKIEYVNNKIDDIEVNMLHFENIKGDGVNDDSIGINEVIEKYKGTGKTLKFPSGIYKCLSPIFLKGIKIKGDFGSPYSSTITKGTLFDFDGGDGFIHDDTTGNDYITNHIEGINITNCNTAIKHTYQVQSTFKNIHITNCEYGLRVGDPTVIGALFCVYENIYVRRARATALVIQGKTFNNSHTFKNCEFFGINGAWIGVSDGLGAINLTFNNCEFATSNMGENEHGQPLGRRGVTLSNTKQTVFNQCYFETSSAAAILIDNSDATFNNCIYGSNRSDNIDGDEAIIIGRNTANYIFVNQGYVETDNTKMKYLTQHDNVDGRIFINQPLRLTPPTIALSKNKNYNVFKQSESHIENDEGAKLRIKTIKETHGYTITRERLESTSYENGVVERFENNIVRHIKDDRVDYNKPVQFNSYIVMKDTEGGQWKVTVTNDGTLTTTRM